MSCKVRYTFTDGAPSEPCEPYSDSEWSALVASVLPQAPSHTPPTAIFISGLPGGGKSSSMKAIHTALSSIPSSIHTPSIHKLPPLQDIAIVDFDYLRNFHQQYKTFSNRPDPTTPSLYHSYKDLIPWMMNGTDFENIFFRDTPNRGLLPLILKNAVSFAMEAVLDSSGCFDFVQHVAGFGYHIVFVHVHVEVDQAIERAQMRAFRTGRWSSPQFIKSREEGLMEWFSPIARFVLEEMHGTVAVYDNATNDKPPSLVYLAPHNSLSPLQHNFSTLWELYRLSQLTAPTTGTLDLLHASKQRRYRIVSEYATSLVSEFVLPRTVSTEGGARKAAFCLAGGCFKALLTGNSPRDLDLWPCSETDRDVLLDNLKASPNATQEGSNQFNQQFRVTSHLGGCALIEVVSKCTPAGLKEKVERFDMALSAVGAKFTLEVLDGKWMATATEVYIHRDWAKSIEQRQPLLILPMPNKPFLLSTAERVVRYAQELKWPTPNAQLQYLHQVFKDQDDQSTLIANYLSTSHGGEPQKVVCDMFRLDLQLK